MLRAAVAALLLLNVLLWSWQRGWLDTVLGLQPQSVREPQRFAQQVRPESVQVLDAQAASSALAAASAAVARATNAANTAMAASATAPPQARASAAPLECLEAGPFTPAEAALAERTLSALPQGEWVRVPAEPGGAANYLVFTGRFPNNDTKLRRLDELKAQGLDATEVRGVPALEPGIVLGRFGTRGEAESALAALAGRNVQPPPRIVPLGGPSPRFRLRFAQADPALRGMLAELQGQVQVLGGGFVTCAAAR
jgi:cell division septation protein DedD